jgi:hypothetical protein
MKRSRNVDQLLRFGLVAAVVAVSISACADDTASTPRRGASSSSGSSGDEDGGEPAYVRDDGTGTGTTWSALYAELFGGKASCAGTASKCHASATAEGALDSKFVCADEAGCKASLLGDSSLVRSTDAANPSFSFLVRTLRREEDGKIVGTQPTAPLFVFHAKTIERIETWIKDGTP